MVGAIIYTRRIDRSFDQLLTGSWLCPPFIQAWHFQSIVIGLRADFSRELFSSFRRYVVCSRGRLEGRPEAAPGRAGMMNMDRIGSAPGPAPRYPTLSSYAPKNVGERW